MIIGKSIKKLLGYFLFFIFYFLFSYNAWADFNLSITPYEGGSSLRFGTVDASQVESREVRLRTTSTEAKQYRIRQRLLEAITNEKGIILPEGAVNFYTVRGSNSFGSLYQDMVRPLSAREDILYTSASAGSSDSFIVVYSVDGSKLTDSGHFRGRILYTLEPQGASPINYTLNIDFDAEVELDVSLESSSGTNRLKLDTKSKDTLKDFLMFTTNTGLGKKINLYQRVESLPCNEKGIALDEQALKFFLSGITSGETSYSTLSSLQRKDTLIYSSPSRDKDSFYINFLIDEEKLADIEAGTYRGRLVYYLEGENISKIMPIDLEINVGRIFDIKVTSEEGLSFTNLKPDSLPQEKTATIKINSNLNKPYQVIQTISTPLTNEKGNTIPDKFFTLRQELIAEGIEAEGKVKSSKFTPVKMGDEVIFTSSTGNSSSVKIIYQLTPSFEALAGNYSTGVTYSLAER